MENFELRCKDGLVIRFNKKMMTKTMIVGLGLLMMAVSASVSQAASEKITIEALSAWTSLVLWRPGLIR
jgi:hypothetical protein